MDSSVVAGFLLFLALAAPGCLVVMLSRKYGATVGCQAALFLTAFALRFGAALLIYLGGGVQVIQDEDASGWVGGVALQQRWEEAGWSPLAVPRLFLETYGQFQQGYTHLLGTLFFVTGTPGRLPAAVLNCFFGALTVVVVYRLARSLFSEGVARRAGWLACLYPTLILWSAQTLKEPVVILLEVLALHSCVQLNRLGFSLRHVLVTSLAIVLLIPFRFYAAYLILGVVLVSLLVPPYRAVKTRFACAFAVTALVVAVFCLSRGLLLEGAQRHPYRYDLESANVFRQTVAYDRGSGVKPIVADLRTPGGLVAGLLVGAAHLLLAPFPWQWPGGSLRLVLTIPEVLLWWALLVWGVWPGLRHSIRYHLSAVLPCLLFLGGMGLLYSLMFGNVGLVYRLRAQFVPPLLIMASVGIELRKRAGTQVEESALLETARVCSCGSNPTDRVDSRVNP